MQAPHQVRIQTPSHRNYSKTLLHSEATQQQCFLQLCKGRLKSRQCFIQLPIRKPQIHPFPPSGLILKRLVPACCHPPAQPPGKPASFPNEINNFACRIKQLPAALARVNKGWEQTTFSQSEGLKRAKGSLQPSCLRSAGRAAAGELAIC